MSYISVQASQYSKIFWFEALRRPPEEQTRYHIYGTYQYTTPLDLSRLERALQAVVNTQYNLRSHFSDESGELFQHIHEAVKVDLIYCVTHTACEYQEIVHEIQTRPFDITVGPLFRFACIVRQENNTTTFVLVFHHIIIDGTQFDALMQKIAHDYHHTPDLTATDQDSIADLVAYVAWEREQISGADVNYWVNALRDYPLTVALPVQGAYRNQKKFQEIAKLYQLDRTRYDALIAFSQTSACSVFTILKTVWALLMTEYSGQDKVIIAYKTWRVIDLQVAIEVNSSYSR